MPIVETVATVIGTTNAGVSLLRNLPALFRKCSLSQNEFREVIEALRDIYFTPNGMRRVLELLAAGKRVDQASMSSAVDEFNSFEWRVERSVSKMAFDRLRSIPDLSLEQREVLDELADFKINLRKDLQNVFNKPGRRIHVSRAQASELLERTRVLNSQIIQMERQLLG